MMPSSLAGTTTMEGSQSGCRRSSGSSLRRTKLLTTSSYLPSSLNPSLEMLCDNSLVDGEINPGSPVVLVIAASAIRVLELLRGVKSFTRECRVAKLFSRHIKVEEQVTLLKNRVNIAGGTPSRIKKLIDMEALGLSRLSLVLLDIRPDVKNYSLLSLPQVKDEFLGLVQDILS